MSSPQRRRVIVSLASVLSGLSVLAACTGTGSGGAGVVYYTNFTAGYVPSSVAASQPLLVETYGSPSPAATPEQVNQATVQALRTSGPAWMPRHYTGNPADAPRPAYRLRIAYAAPKGFKLDELCETEASSQLAGANGAGSEEGSTRTLASLCRGDNAIAYGEGSPGSNPDIAGERFRNFVGLLGRQVMPRHNPVTEDDCVFRNCD